MAQTDRNTHECAKLLKGKSVGNGAGQMERQSDGSRSDECVWVSVNQLLCRP